ncbi:MAG: ParB N-terminal domain-containing protein, partial [Hyphomicrobiaceae bacterium]
MQRQFRTLSPVKPVSGNAPSAVLGERAELCMLPLDRLVVDESYQRPITGKGRLNINRIVAKFDWRKFAPLVVTEVDGGRYAIIDGQHRATAALMHPDVHLVPCMVVKASVAEAA